MVLVCYNQTVTNLYTPSDILSLDQFQKLEKAFELAWSKDTTYPDCKEEWNETNKAFGQCAITTLVVYDLYGGRIIYDKVNFHLWNELPDETQQDFSRSQFLEERVFSIYKYKTKENVLYDETGLRTKIEDRYKLLKNNFQLNLLKITNLNPI